MTEIEASQRRFMQSCEIEPPPEKMDGLEKTVLAIILGAAAGYSLALLVN
jgi:hypothetical protein